MMPQRHHRPQRHDLVFSGAGIILPSIHSVGNLLERLRNETALDSSGYSLEGFQPAAFLGANRKLLKAVSWYHGFGLAAVAECQRDGRLVATGETPSYSKDLLGLYVGAPPSSCFDNANYVSAVAETRQANGDYSERAFGTSSQKVLGTTLLRGLPNNVLCYGSMILGAHGPNSNYLAGEVSGHLGVVAALRTMRRNRLAAAVIGGYSHTRDAIVTGMWRQWGDLLPENSRGSIRPFSKSRAAGTIPADGAAFLVLEPRQNAVQRGAPVRSLCLAATTAATGLGPRRLPVEQSAAALAYAMRAALNQAGVSSAQVGLVFLTGSGLTRIDSIEAKALQLVFSSSDTLPALTSLTPVTGNIGEAGGLAEAAIAADFYRDGRVPSAVALHETDLATIGFTSRELTLEKPYCLIVRSSWLGDFSCLLIQVEDPQESRS